MFSLNLTYIPGSNTFPLIDCIEAVGKQLRIEPGTFTFLDSLKRAVVGIFDH